MAEKFNREIETPPRTSQSAILDTIIECFSATSTHGLPNIMRTRRIEFKVIWLIFVLIATGAFVGLATLTVQTYLGFDVVTQIRVEPELESTFPTVTICQSTNGPEATEATLGRDGNISSYMITCMFNDIRCDDAYSNFEWFYNTNTGYCIQFNRQGNLKIIRAGWHNGLQLEMYVGVLERSRRTGLRIFIHNASFVPSDTKDISVATGTRNNIVVSRLFYEKEPTPYSACIDDASLAKYQPNTLYHEIIAHNRTYAQRTCYDFAIQYYNIQKMNCSLPIYTNLFNTPQCEGKWDAFRFYHNDAEFIKLYKSMCPLECKSGELDFTVTYMSYPSATYMKLLRKSPIIRGAFPNGATDEQVRASVVQLFIFYDSLEYTSIKELPSMTTISLISNLGGILGVFLGMSLLTLMEFAEMFVEILLILKN